jgi:branched-subunit amino acid aminotransferase/4-amino-4-deoxychorismate lyase
MIPPMAPGTIAACCWATACSRPCCGSGEICPAWTPTWPGWRPAARTLGLPVPTCEEAARLCAAAPDEAGLGDGRAAVRLTLTAGSGGRGWTDPPRRPRLVARAAAVPPTTPGRRLILARTRRNEGSPAARLKTLSYLDNVLARAEAKAAGADEAVMLNNRGELACAAAANLFWIAGDGSSPRP